jgi:glutathione synthase/RimK-type ligase-like ATP-grasp enzyme
MKNCAFLTMDSEHGFVIDDALAHKPLAELGWRVSPLSWKQTGIPWSDFDAVIIRSTWDYPDDVNLFLAVLEEINSASNLANAMNLVRWNLAKTYLRDLEHDGIGIVPTLWANEIDEASIDACHGRFESDEMVIKPAIGVNGVDAFRISRSQSDRDLSSIVERFQGRAHMVQRFMPCILTEGEYSLFFFNCDFSHAILKTPADSEFRSQEERGASIKAVEPEELLLARGRQVMETITPAPLYARIDFVRDDEGEFVVMELELIEPSLYLRMHPQAPARFAEAIDAWFV